MKYLTIDSDNKILGWNEDTHVEGCIETDSVIPEYTDTQSLYWEGKTVVAKDDDEKITTKAERIATQYARARQALYPAIGDQLDDLYHAGVFSAEMTATLKKVKDDNPK